MRAVVCKWLGAISAMLCASSIRVQHIACHLLTFTPPFVTMLEGDFMQLSNVNQ